MASSSSSLTLHLLLLPPLNLPKHKSSKFIPFHTPRRTSSLHPFSISSSSSSSSWENEETRWLREEKRWLREEQRWLREESRWNSERERLLEEIAILRSRIHGLERGKPEELVVAELGSPVKRREIAEVGLGPIPMVLEVEREEEDVKEVVVREVKVEKGVKKMKKLKRGSEGEDVRKMQEALQKLGFYSGEEDMEYSSFSSGTERAVKTWQASLGASEDGIMSEELLEKLFMGKGMVDANLKDIANGTPVASTMEVSEIERKVVEENSAAEFKDSHHRVFLLGENRWEEPSRLTNRHRRDGGRKTEIDSMKCITCRGEGRLLCTECDGTGEPNIEEQFMDWVDEGAKCPYCEGLGYNICDVCEGKTMIKA